MYACCGCFQCYNVTQHVTTQHGRVTVTQSRKPDPYSPALDELHHQYADGSGSGDICRPLICCKYRVRNNMRPSVIFRAFQQDDRPTNYLQRHDGQTIRYSVTTQTKLRVIVKSWVWSKCVTRNRAIVQACLCVIAHYMKETRALDQFTQLFSAMKRRLPSFEDGASSSKQENDQLQYILKDQWPTELDKESQTITECEKAATGTVTALKCGLCIRFQSMIERIKTKLQ